VRGGIRGIGDAKRQIRGICGVRRVPPFLERAEAADAQYLVTGNIRHFPKNYERVAIVTPRALLHRLLSEKE